MRELGIEQVFAWSPQAQGNGGNALAGTFQDRLVTELRLANVRSLEEANRLLVEYLPRYNEKFGVPAVDEGSAYRPLPPEMDLANVLCFKHRRKAARDNTVKYQWRTLQLLPGADRRSYAGRAVEVWERLDGELSVLYEVQQEIATQEAPPRVSVLRGSKGGDQYKDRARFMKQVEACLPTTAKPARQRGGLSREDQPHGCRPTGRPFRRRRAEDSRFARSPESWGSPEARSRSTSRRVAPLSTARAPSRRQQTRD